MNNYNKNKKLIILIIKLKNIIIDVNTFIYKKKKLIAILIY